MKIKFGPLALGLAALAALTFTAFAPRGVAFAADPAAAGPDAVVDGPDGCPGWWGDHGFYDHPGLRHSIIENAAETLGLSFERVHADLRAGLSLNEIGRAHGFTTQRLENGILANERDDLDRQVANGKITRDEERLIMIFLQNHIDQIVRHHGLARCYETAPTTDAF